MRNITLALATFSAFAACDTGERATYDPIAKDRSLVWRTERACIDLGEPVAWSAVQYSDGSLYWSVAWSNDDLAWMVPSVQFTGYREGTQ